MKKNVLVFPCGSEIGLELHRSLEYSTHFNLIGASSVDDHGKFIYSDHIEGVPFVDDDKFVDEINRIVESRGIHYIFPAHDSVVLRLAQAEAELKLKCRVVTSPYETCRIARSKAKSYEALKDVITTPISFDPNEEIAAENFPLFVKPEVGQGSKGTARINTRAELDVAIAKDPTLLVLECLPGKEYTVDCFTDAGGELVYVGGRERRRVSNGISVNSVALPSDRFEKIAQNINSNLAFRGAWFFQVMERGDGELVLLEIATRVAGTMGLSRAKGVNLPLMSLFDMEGLPVSVLQNSHDVEIDRALENKFKIDIKYRHVYIDFDDLVLVSNKVNTQVVGFMYQCVNNGVKLHLLTRHERDIHETLRHYRLQGIFDSVTKVSRDEKKSSYIKERDAIFIDDSFAERRDVHEITGLSVFDTHMIECLTD